MIQNVETTKNVENKQVCTHSRFNNEAIDYNLNLRFQ